MKTVFALLLLSAHSVLAATRVALVSTCAGDASKDVLALATAKLSEDRGIALVERAQVERVLQEQMLWQCGLSDYEQALAAGKLLGVEVFAALEMFPDSREALGLVAFDASSGVRLWDVALPADGVDKIVEGIAAAVRAACKKRQQPAANLRTVCLLSVRNADLPREMDSFCWSVGMLVERQLVQSPNLAVLERRRLEHVNKERDLPTSDPVKQLLASLVLVDLEVSRAESGKGVTATATLTDGAGTKLANLDQHAAEELAVDLAQGLVGQMLKLMRAASSSTAPDRAREAKRFCREAHFLSEHREARAALRAAEAAFALDQLSHDNRVLLVFTSLAVASIDLADGHADDALGLAARAAQCGDSSSFENRDDLAKFLAKAASAPSAQNAETRRKMVAIQRVGLERFFAKPVEDSSNGVKDVEGFANPYRFAHWFSSIRCFSPTSGEWTTHTIRMLSCWLQRPAAWHDKPVLLSGVLREPMAVLRQSSPPAAWEVTPEDYRKWTDFYLALTRHEHPAIQMYGMMGQVVVEAQAKTLSKPQIRERIRAIVDFAKSAMTDPTTVATTGNPTPARSDEGSSFALQPHANSFRLTCYQAALDAIDLLSLDEFPQTNRWEACDDLLKFMSKRRELSPAIIQRVTPGVANLDTVIAMLDSPDVEMLHSEVDHLSQQYGDRQMLRGSLLAQRGALLAKDVQRAEDQPVPWTQARLLLDPVKHGFQRLGPCRVVNGGLYALTLTQKANQREMQPVFVSLPQGNVLPLTSAPYNWEAWNDFQAGLPGLAVGANELVAGTRENGIFVFPLDGGPIQQITEGHGLPSNRVRSIALLDGEIFAGLWENAGYVVSYGLLTRKTHVIASSRRKTNQSPLDDITAPYTVRNMWADPPRHRIVFMVESWNKQGNRFQSESSVHGLWQYDLRTKQLTYLQRIRMSVLWASADRRDALWLATFSPWRLLSFDLNSNQAQVLHDYGPRSKWQLPPASERTISFPCEMRPPFLGVNDWVWSGDPFSRSSSDGQRVEYFPRLDGTRAPTMAFSHPFLELTSDGDGVLVAEDHRLWLLTLPTK